MRRRSADLFRISKVARIYDRASGKFSFNISYETNVKLSDRTLVVAEAFGLGIDEAQKFTVLDTELRISPNDITYITGDSGSGKSVLLRALREDLGGEAIELNEIKIDQDKPLIETVGATVEEGLELLSKVGLNDAFLFLRSYNQLSDGQKYRYKIAKLIESKKQWFLYDEFCACLDRDTAKIVAFNLQKIARRQNKAVIVATTHTDLFQDLAPSVHVHKRFGKEISVEYYSNKPATECSIVQEMHIEPGTTKDWNQLAPFHYRSHRVSAIRKIFSLKRGNELCGIVIYCYPPPCAYGRRMVLPKMTFKQMNKKLSCVNRVVIHPKYRTIGLGAKLIEETLPLAGTPYVEMVAVMAKFNPFAEHAGLKNITRQEPAKTTQKVADLLTSFGFNTQLLGSEKYVTARLNQLTTQQTQTLKNTLMKAHHPRIAKEFTTTRHVPYGKPKDYKKEIEQADIPKMARVLKVIGMLLQTKIYLFGAKQKRQRSPSN
jgi:ABC-type lipoprotein export system ATPase subunit